MSLPNETMGRLPTTAEVIENMTAINECGLTAKKVVDAVRAGAFALTAEEACAKVVSAAWDGLTADEAIARVCPGKPHQEK